MYQQLNGKLSEYYKMYCIPETILVISPRVKNYFR